MLITPNSLGHVSPKSHEVSPHLFFLFTSFSSVLLLTAKNGFFFIILYRYIYKLKLGARTLDQTITTRNISISIIYFLFSFFVSVAGGFSEWSNWSKCSVTCGGGTQQRNRSCTNPRPEKYGTKCKGPAHETKTCASKMCPTTGDCSYSSLPNCCKKSHTDQKTNFL